MGSLKDICEAIQGFQLLSNASYDFEYVCFEYV